MRLIYTDSYDEMSEVAAQIMLGVMHSKSHRVNIAPTTGTSPKRLYEILAPKLADVDYFDHVHYYGFDETPFRKSTHKEGRIQTNLRNMFLTPAKVKEENMHPLTLDNYQDRDKELEEQGGLDLIVLGLGEDGHFCCNFPHYAKFDQMTVGIPMEGSLYDMYAEIFDEEEEISELLLTMGPKAVMKAKEILLIVNGDHKKEILDRILTGPVDENIPATILPLHPNITIVVDPDAASIIKEKGVK